MSEWKRYKLSDLYEMSSGISSTKEQAGHGSPFLSFSVVFNNYFLPDNLIDLMDTTDGEKQKYSINEGDIFLTRTSETVDELAMSSVALKDYPEASFSGFLKRLRPVDKTIVYPKFMAFYLRSPLFRRTIINNTVMTLRASFNEAMFSYLEIMLPDFDTQKKIGDFLYSLEKKKQINNQINQELEAMAKTLYDYWFVQFDFPDQNGKPYKSSGGKMVYNQDLKREIPEGWGVEKLGDVAKFKNGINYEKTSSGSEKVKIINVRNISSSTIFVNQTDLDEISLENDKSTKFIVNEGMILITRSGIPGATRLVSELEAKTVYSGFIIASEVNDLIFKNLIFYYLKNVEEVLKNQSAGTIMKNISQSVLTDMVISLPPQNVLLKFNSIIDNLLEQMKNVQRQNQELTQLRDWLLPMLMNGQVKVE
ncbi:MAG: restriction endonuclease subunit S [Candidatus Saccharibacteria bacterium]|nr:restriction endonuclease subunit S [Candidatus Saccharibacteria bacterium]